jgi:peptide/nickel transport system permease protein
VTLAVVTALSAPILAPADPNEQDVPNRLKPPAWQAGGTLRHALGTDHLGRDLLSRIIYGSRLTLAVGVAAVGVSTALGVTLGLVSGFWRGTVDSVVSGVVDASLALPTLLIAVTVAGLLGASLLNLVFVLAITQWMTYAKVVRGEVLTLREREFVQAARVLGSSAGRILRVHILRNVTSSILVISTLNLAQVILIEASLNFLGLGVPPSVPSWGAMLNDGRSYLAVAWWLATLPGVAIAVTVLGANLLGDWARDLLDPRLRAQ